MAAESMHPFERWHPAWVVAGGFVLAGSPVMAAASDVSVGGYHDQALRAAQVEWLGSGPPVIDGGAAAAHLTFEAGPTTTKATFTPRFGGLAPAATGRPGQASGPPPARQVTVGLNNTSTIAGISVDWSAKAAVSHEPPAQAGDPSSFVVGGELAVSGVRFDAAYGEHATVLGVSGNRMTAGIAYGFGPIDARISYSVVSAEDETAASLVTLGSRLTLQPGLILQGDLAYAEEQSSGDAATAGVVSLRFNF
jgi:hypothetical protein